MTILIMYQAVRYKDFKTYYVELIKIYWKYYFPTSSSYNRFVELIDIAMLPLIAFISSNHGKHTDLYFIDATKLLVCHNLREYRYKVFKSLAAKGKTSTGWFFGFKLNYIGEIISINISPGNKDDRSFLTKLCKGLKGLVFGDRGYISKDKAQLFEKQGLKLITALKKNMKKVHRLLRDLSLRLFLIISKII
ncbi:transposase DDE domain protein [Francisella frigiditurris]|uniref:Transposase DDE domain protein n=1 Tax=Francisella frigiditurris TaxID=1542390 RepID=A0A1J0KSJ8_9GAMM|nr:transposase DDE domain protein [Francisella frigiditurris]